MVDLILGDNGVVYYFGDFIVAHWLSIGLLKDGYTKTRDGIYLLCGYGNSDISFRTLGYHFVLS